MSEIGQVTATAKVTAIGRVTSIEGNRIVIQQDCFTDAQSAGEAPCFGCLKTECKSPYRTITVENTENLPLQKGDSVKIEVIPGRAFFQTLTALGAPILGFITGFFFTGLFFPDSKDPARAACGVLLMCIAAFGFYQLRRRFPAKNPFRIILDAYCPR
jgi:hypothetical protein